MIVNLHRPGTMAAIGLDLDREPDIDDPRVIRGVITGANAPDMLSIMIECQHCGRSKRKPYQHFHGWPADWDHRRVSRWGSHCWRGPLAGEEIWLTVFPPDHPRSAEHVFPPGRILTPEEYAEYRKRRNRELRRY